MFELWPRPRLGPQSQALHFSYEKAGLTIPDQPIPWNAEAVLVEALVRLPVHIPRRKNDFALRLPGMDPIQAENLRVEAGELPDHFRLFFRLPPPGRTANAEIVYRNHTLGQLVLPYLDQDEFIQQVRLQLAALYVRLGEQNVACQTFVGVQGRGLIASALLTSPTCLAPILDLGLHVEFRAERGGAVDIVAARLCASQLAGRQALLNVAPPKLPRRLGAWTATWLLADQPLGPPQRVRSISLRHFQRSLRVVDTRFVLQSHTGAVSTTRHIPQTDTPDRLGPCFLVASREPGMAGLCPLQVQAVIPGAVKPIPLLDEEVLITDGPTMVAPGTLDGAELAQVSSFELRLKEEILGVVSLSPAPAASFNTEGGFTATADFSWTPAAEEELSERMNRLLEESKKA